MGFFFLFEDEPVFHENQELVDVLQDSRVVVDVFDLVEDRRLEGVNCHPDAGGGHVQVTAHEEQELFLGLSAGDLEGEGEDALEVFSPGGILLPFDVPQKLYVFLTANRILSLNKDRILAVHKLAWIDFQKVFDSDNGIAEAVLVEHFPDFNEQEKLSMQRLFLFLLSEWFSNIVTKSFLEIFRLWVHLKFDDQKWN
jgi:hypothetical protein